MRRRNNRAPETSENDGSKNSSDDSSSYDLSMGRGVRKLLQPPMFKLVKESRWEKLARILKRKRNHWRCNIRDDAGMTLLGMVLSHHAPPLEIIQLIIDATPDQLTDIDVVCGANPLHIACLNGVMNNIVSFLLEECIELAYSKDKDHRTPLHYAAECICNNRIDLREGMKVIETLYLKNSAMIHALDHEGCSPMDIVHIARCDLDKSDNEGLERLTILSRYLRKISCKVYKAKKKLWEDKIIFNAEKMNLVTPSSAYTSRTVSSSNPAKISFSGSSPWASNLDVGEERTITTLPTNIVDETH